MSSENRKIRGALEGSLVSTFVGFKSFLIKGIFRSRKIFCVVRRISDVVKT